MEASLGAAREHAERGAEATRRARGKSWTSSRRRTRGRREDRRAAGPRTRNARVAAGCERGGAPKVAAASSRGRSPRRGGDKGSPTSLVAEPIQKAAPPQRETRKHLAADAFDAERSVEPTTPAPAIGGGVAATRAREMAARKRAGKTPHVDPAEATIPRAIGAAPSPATPTPRTTPPAAELEAVRASLTAAKAENAALREMMEGQVEKARAESAAKAAKAREEVEALKARAESDARR